MTASYMTIAGFALICALLLTLPFIPALQEWLHPTDVASLPVNADYSSDIDHFARRLQGDATARLGKSPSTGFEEFDFVDFPVENMDWSKARNRLIARQSIQTPEAISSETPLYVEGDLQAGPKSSFSAVYATGNIDLDTDSAVHDWAHADGTLKLHANCVALRRVSAGVSIKLGREVWFERIQAPTLHFGSAADLRSNNQVVTQTVGSYADLPDAVQQTPLLFLIRGDCALPAGKIYTGSLVVTGFLTVGHDTTITGDVKAREGISLGRSARVEGAITCEKRIYVFKQAFAFGPVISESDVLIGSGAVIGLPDATTTVSAVNIIVEEGATVHGAVWAHEIGMVKAA